MTTLNWCLKIVQKTISDKMKRRNQKSIWRSLNNQSAKQETVEFLGETLHSEGDCRVVYRSFNRYIYYMKIVIRSLKKY